MLLSLFDSFFWGSFDIFQALWFYHKSIILVKLTHTNIRNASNKKLWAFGNRKWTKISISQKKELRRRWNFHKLKWNKFFRRVASKSDWASSYHHSLNNLCGVEKRSFMSHQILMISVILKNNISHKICS